MRCMRYCGALRALYFKMRESWKSSQEKWDIYFSLVLPLPIQRFRAIGTWKLLEKFNTQVKTHSMRRQHDKEQGETDNKYAAGNEGIWETGGKYTGSKSGITRQGKLN